MNLNSRLARLEREWIAAPIKGNGASDSADDGADGPGIWISWHDCGASGDCLRDGGEALPSARRQNVLFYQWLAGLEGIENGDAFFVSFTNMHGAARDCKWHVYAYGGKFKPLWTDGMDHVSLSLIQDLKRLSPAQLEWLGYLKTLSDEDAKAILKEAPIRGQLDADGLPCGEPPREA